MNSGRTSFILDKEWKFSDEKFESDNSKMSHGDSYMISKAGYVGGTGAINFDDSEWHTLNLPHDYFVETEFSPDNLHSHGYKTRGNGWYRKTFKIDESMNEKHFLLCFEGISVTAEIYFNGSVIGRSFSAYAELPIDVTDRMHFGDTPNVIAVSFNGMTTEGWWYEGAGIYRHVRLIAKDMLHIAHNGLFVKPICRGGNGWTVEVETTVENSSYSKSDYRLHIELTDGKNIVAERNAVNFTCGADSQNTENINFQIENPILWDINNPKLYHAKAELIRDGSIVDCEETDFGFRTIHFDADKGFFLNGKSLKLKGTCNHQDHAGVGVAVPDSIQYYRIKRLKELGTNAYRCSHNMPSREILDACDRLGMLVMDENRRFESRPEVIAHVEMMVRRDRNHPSVIMYSLFNEEPLQGTNEGRMIFKRMKSAVLKLDNTRYITGAMNGGINDAGGAALEQDVTGINYSINGITAFHEAYPNQPIVGSENNSAVTTRGCYKSDREKANVLNCYDEERVPWGQLIRETWDYTRKNDFMSGIFIWTGFDYRGEPTPFTWPSCSSQFGIMDTCGFAKDSFWQNKVCFTDEPILHILPHWNWNDGEEIRVQTATNGDEAELFLNGVSLGRKASDVCAPAEWTVKFSAGILSAIAYKNGNEIARAQNITSGKPASIKLIPDRTYIFNDGADTVPVNVCVLDHDGNIVPTADNHICFTIKGDGIILGVGNGNPNSHESDVLPERDLFAGWCQALLQSSLGAKNIEITAESDGLECGSIVFDVKAAPAPNYIFAAVNQRIEGWTVSAANSCEKPNALIRISDDDMNSFEPVSFGWWQFLSGFKSGYRIYRAFVKIPKSENPNIGNVYTIDFGHIKASETEIYADGKQIFADTSVDRNVKAEFSAHIGDNIEIRVLVKAKDDEDSGIANGVKLI